jgi:hypothetical protein
LVTVTTSVYQEGASVTVAHQKGLWVARYVTPGHPPKDRGGVFEVQVEMPACQRVRVLLMQ